MTPKEIGNLLKKERQKKSFSLEHVYKHTRIQPRMIEALEEGNADGALDRVYVLLFVKKYAAFLGLDPAELSGKYKSFYNRQKKKEEEEKPEKPSGITLPEVNIDFKGLEKWRMFALPAASVLAAVVIFIFLGFRIKAFLAGRKETQSALSRRALPEGAAALRENGKISGLFPLPANKPLNLTLRSENDAWMKVEQDGKVAFQGTLAKNESRTWVADSRIELRVGRAEALDFIINGVPVGKIGRGNVKDIRLTREGLQIGRKWLIKAD